jgi:uncharacterized membrane protein
MTRIVVAYAATLLTFGAVDFVWLGFVAAGFYRSEIGPLLLPEPNWLPALLFYPVYVAGTVFFCVVPALRDASWPHATGRGALFGLIAYATYDLTNLATLAGWSLAVTVVDIGWGAAVTGLAATAGYLAAASATDTSRP